MNTTEAKYTGRNKKLNTHLLTKMADSRRESLLFYKYLCNKIGTQVDVRTRRLSFIICDIHNHPYKRSPLKLFPQISSGSKTEGLDLSGSDVDIMLIDNRFEVYESERDVVQGRKVVLIMDTEDNPHCFSKLRVLTDYNRAYNISGRFKRLLHFEGSKCLLSSELYKMHNLNMIRQDAPKFDTIHGPCISDPNERFNEQNKATLMKLLKDAYNKDVKCFASSKTLNDYQNYITGITDRVVSIEREIMKIFSNGQALLNHGNVFLSVKIFPVPFQEFLIEGYFHFVPITCEQP
ncbi:unnamed protein product [Mytilus edulis]|uniref:Uncharacterized protein n=1 Tax=Mytilus edulis TaxID=6550 RepID=A0A8S3S787_MYTED|nr:unnamed protein product [Mytilus edulis]